MFHAFDNPGPNRPTPRPDWMALLSRAPLPLLEQGLAGRAHAVPRWLRKPETGLYMVQGRAGGTGQRFNLGELTVTRCALRLDDGEGAVGVAYVMGRNHRQAQLAAVADALLQDPAHHEALETSVLQPVRHHLARQQAHRAARAQSTKVDFFTVAREAGTADEGEDRMKADDLQQVRPGFHDAALGSLAVFRTALDALSHPGRVHTMPPVSELPLQGHGAAAMLLQALVDSDCSVWLSPSLAQSDAAAWLRFHTGCHLAASPGTARFLWVAQGDAQPALATLDAGSDEYPDQSATCVVEVAALDGADGDGLVLTGPGIATERALSVQGLPDDFAAQWDNNHQRFPCGVDLFLTTATQITGLPRTTRIRATEGT